MLFLDPFHGGSHRAFARGWAERSRHRITILDLPPRFWKWRLRGAAFAFAERLERLDAMGPRPGDGGEADARPSAARRPDAWRSDARRASASAQPEPDRRRERRAGWDVVVATSLMDAAAFMATARLDAPLVVYFHENQLSYPRPPGEPLDHGLALASLSSAAAADAVVFNSRFHRGEFFRGLGEWIARFPEHAPLRAARAIERRTLVIPPGLDWEALAPLAAKVRESERRPGAGPLILWNHRWEFDKNPGAFFSAMRALAQRGWTYRLALLGENTQFVPKPFLEAREALGPRIVRYGFARTTASYRAWLGRADIVVSTSRQENFGLSVTEAISAGAFPVLPARLSYPEILPAHLHPACLYQDQRDLIARLERLIAHPDELREGRRARSLLMRRYDWSRIAPELDDLVARISRASSEKKGKKPSSKAARGAARSRRRRSVT